MNKPTSSPDVDMHRNNQPFIPLQSKIDRFMETKYSLFYDILSHDASSDNSANSIYDKVLLLKNTLSQAVDELERLVEAKENAKNHVKALISSISDLKHECALNSIKTHHLKSIIERKRIYLDSISKYIDNNLLLKYTFKDGEDNTKMTLELFDFGMESIRLFGDKNRVFMRYYQLFNGILDSFPLIIELFNNYIDSGTQSLKSLEVILSELEMRNVYSLKQFNQFPDLMYKFEENLSENSSESKLYIEQVRLMREGVLELRTNIGELKRQKTYLQKGVKEIKEGLTLLNRHLDGIREFNENTDILKSKDAKLIEVVLSKSATLEKLFINLHSQRKEALCMIEKYKDRIEESDLEAFLDVDAHIAHTFNVSEVLDDLTIGD
ncbi:hypothetical protein MDAP_001538 [Mitosporidium daphniae]